jgi:hypothetical protein
MPPPSRIPGHFSGHRPTLARAPHSGTPTARGLSLQGPAATRRAGARAEARARGLVLRPGPRMPCPLIAQSKALGCTGRPAGRAGPAGPALPVALGAGLHSHRGLKARFKIRHGAPEQDTHGLCAASVSIGPNWMSRPGRVRAVYVRLTWHDLASRCGS